MCGIVGMIHKTSIVSLLMPALKRLEYRGYDSSGIAVFQDNQLTRYRALGVLQNLQDTLPSLTQVTTGMGHTRWATHGEPCVRNAHPHFSQRVAVVHNGIIENFSELKSSLSAKGYVFESDTDTEVIAHLIDSLYTDISDIMTAFRQAVELLQGHFTIVCMIQGYPQSLLVARRGTPPLLLGRGVQGHSIS
jgi:glucosamine--fructose-6-phosphate aminotransferase (isomerizing)